MMKRNDSNHTISTSQSNCSHIAEEDKTDFTMDDDFDFDDDDSDMSIMSDISNPRCESSEHASSSSLASIRSTKKSNCSWATSSTMRRSFSNRPSQGDDPFMRSFSNRSSQGDESFTDAAFSLLEERAFQKLQQMQQASAGHLSQSDNTSDQQLVNTSRSEHIVRSFHGGDADCMIGSISRLEKFTSDF